MRLLQLAVVVALVMVAIAGLFATASPKRVAAVGGSQPDTASSVESLLAGIPERAAALGNPDAPVTLLYFGDLECPFCREFTLDSLPSIINRWVRSGVLKIEYLAMKTATKRLSTFKLQQVAALAAGKQNKLWYFIDFFYHEQGAESIEYVNDPYLSGIAQQVPGLNLARWRRSRRDPKLLEQVLWSERVARRLRLYGTPSFFIGRTHRNLRRYEPSSLSNPIGFDEAIQATASES